MKALISVEFYKLRHIRLVWAAILIPVGMSMYLALNRSAVGYWKFCYTDQYVGLK